MTKTELYSDILKEKCYKYVLDCGLELFVVPKTEQSSNFAIFGTKFGGVYCDFTINGKKEVHVPQGTAHYLEHKLFESEEQDAFERFTKTGASSNAYTSWDRTCYLFSCTDNFYDSYDILLDFVQTPYFTEKTVEKERGIIGQEIKMYEDTPERAVVFNALKEMYHNNPVKIEVGGTVEEIQKITADTLYECYNAYYNLNNMFICICGNLDPDEVLSFTEKRIKNEKKVNAELIPFDEPESIKNSIVEDKAEVGLPLFYLGFKEKNGEGVCDIKKQLMDELILDILASGKTPLHNRLINEGLINSKFGFDITAGPGYLFNEFYGESSNPQKVKEIIFEEIEKARINGLNEEIFEMSKKSAYANEIKSYDSVEEIVDLMVDGAVSGYNFLEITELLKNITIDMLNNELQNILQEDKCVLSVINPKKK